ncbi:MAG: hypothetical protein LBC89_02445 [Bacteroidales bacterium]|jgi:DNA-binding helix-hairpin-helix protein with protein kinase domain|nr:hypothetical protein [Bacteroidales bacterium]
MGYNVITSKGEKIVLEDTPFSKGGEGEVRKIISAPSAYANCCVKIYYKHKRTQEQANKIRFMVNNPPAQIKGNGFMIGWAIETIHHLNKEFIGFIMPLAFSGSEQLVNLTATNLNTKRLGMVWHKYSRDNGKYALVSRLKLMNNIAIPIHLLHATGKYVLKDFKPQNVLVTHSGQVTVCDMDSIQITNGQRVLFHATAATKEYIPPEFYNQGVGISVTTPLEKSWDNFALSVVFYQLLFGLHPYMVTPKHQRNPDSLEISENISDDLFPFGNNSHKIANVPKFHNKFNILPQKIQELFKRSFSIIPSQRPDAEEWGKNIHEIIKSAGDDPAPPMPTPKPAPSPQYPQPIPRPPEPIPTPPNTKTTEKLSGGMWLIIILVPIIGFIAMFVYFIQAKKKKARSAIIAALIGVLILQTIIACS